MRFSRGGAVYLIWINVLDPFDVADLFSGSEPARIEAPEWRVSTLPSDLELPAASPARLMRWNWVVLRSIKEEV